MNKRLIKNINIVIKYSPEFETQRVLSALEKIDWYKEKGYSVNLPENLALIDIKNISKKDIQVAISKEYDIAQYKSIKLMIEKEWRQISRVMMREITRTNLIPQQSYDIFFTKYGVGGSYNLPNRVIVNIYQKSFEKILRTISHEIVHLFIELFIKKYEVDHWHKERVVDLILFKIFRDSYKMQKLPNQTEVIDETFNKFFPDIEKILSLIGNKK